MIGFTAKLESALRVLREDKKPFFKYGAVQGEMWRKLLNAARDEHGIDFDTENDEDVGQESITIGQGHTACTFNCELRIAGGDWQFPTAYFRCQLVDGICDSIGMTELNSYFIFIPSKDQGNKNLIKDGDGWRAMEEDDVEGPTKKRDQRPNDDQCWRALREHLAKLVKDEVKRNSTAKEL